MSMRVQFIINDNLFTVEIRLVRNYTNYFFTCPEFSTKKVIMIDFNVLSLWLRFELKGLNKILNRYGKHE